MTAPSERMSDTAGTPEWVTRYEKSARPDHAECARDYRAMERVLADANERGDRWSLLAQEQDAKLTAKASECERLRAALELALAHAVEMREAWRSGEVSSINGRSAWLSNMNVEVETAARKALKGE